MFYFFYYKGTDFLSLMQGKIPKEGRKIPISTWNDTNNIF